MFWQLLSLVRVYVVDTVCPIVRLSVCPRVRVRVRVRVSMCPVVRLSGKNTYPGDPLS